MKLENCLTPKMNRRIGNVLADYSMLDDGDKVLAAVSGGVDSLVMVWLLHNWRNKAPIDYHLQAVTIENRFDLPDGTVRTPTGLIEQQLTRMGLSLKVIKAKPMADREMSCFGCARNRRNLLFDLAEQEGYSKIGFGHHKDDLVETLFINLLYGGNISTMLPRQQLFDGRLSLIRPLAYLEKVDVLEIAKAAGIEPVKNNCPLSGETRRETVREILKGIYRQEPEAKNSIFAALANVRQEYLL